MRSQERQTQVRSMWKTSSPKRRWKNGKEHGEEFEQYKKKVLSIGEMFTKFRTIANEADAAGTPAGGKEELL